jgi:hypothetical protein
VLDIENRSPVQSSAQLTELNVAGGLEVQSLGSLDLKAVDVSARQVSVEHEFWIDIMSVHQSVSPTSVQLSRLEVAEDLSIDNQGRLDFQADNLKIGGNVNISSPGWSWRALILPHIDPGSNYTFSELTVFGNFRFEQTGGGDTSIDLTDSSIGGTFDVDQVGTDTLSLNFARVEFNGDSSINMGAGDDRLRILDSVFRGFAEFDGGPGEDASTLNDVDFQGGFRFLNFGLRRPRQV